MAKLGLRPFVVGLSHTQIGDRGLNALADGGSFEGATLIELRGNRIADASADVLASLPAFSNVLKLWPSRSLGDDVGGRLRDVLPGSVWFEGSEPGMVVGCP